MPSLNPAKRKKMKKKRFSSSLQPMIVESETPTEKREYKKANAPEPIDAN